MKLLKSKRAYMRWFNDSGYKYCNIGDANANAPKEYPCYGYDRLVSYGMEQSEPLYLYISDLRSMIAATGASPEPDGAYIDALKDIAEMTDGDNPESYRNDDPHKCLEVVFDTATNALKPAAPQGREG